MTCMEQVTRNDGKFQPPPQVYGSESHGVAPSRGSRPLRAQGWIWARRRKEQRQAVQPFSGVCGLDGARRTRHRRQRRGLGEGPVGTRPVRATQSWRQADGRRCVCSAR
ncbi:hypothetical protein V5799_030970 [Amblyomma americanum]|uniref:Uncharacterized protein n=1 Tax=Amblyomma americanum TaxID=6943 RepID=A0AAQ4ELM2_AMBAM